MAELNNLKSSNLKKASYDKKTKVLIVEFQNDTAYQYENFPEFLWNQFADTVNSDGSAGAFFHKHIKNLPSQKLEN